MCELNVIQGDKLIAVIIHEIFKMKTPLLKGILVSIVMICSTCTESGVCAPQSVTGDYTFEKLPLFFVTDREVKIRQSKSKYSFGKQLDKPAVVSSDDVACSNLTFGIEEHKTRMSDELKAKGGWRNAFELDIFGDRFEPKGMKWRTFSGLIYGHMFGWSERQKFYGQLSGCLSKCPTNEIILFVHGCCVDHKKASRQAINFEKWYRRPVILYDWGTKSKDYYQSLTAYQKTQKRFEIFVNDLKERFPDAKINVIAYSVGANILKDYCSQTREDQPKQFESVVILRADTNIGELESSLPDIVARCSNPVQIWASKNDAQIIASRFLRTLKLVPKSIAFIKGPRAGESLAWNKKIHQGVQILDISNLNLGHDIPYKLLSVMSRKPLREQEKSGYAITGKDHSSHFVVDVN